MNANEEAAAQQPSGQAKGTIDVSCLTYSANYFGLKIGTVIFGPKYNDNLDVVEYFERCENDEPSENPTTQPIDTHKMFSLAAPKQGEFIKKIDDIKETLPENGYRHTNIGIISDVWTELVKGNFLSTRQCQQGLQGLKRARFPTGGLES